MNSVAQLKWMIFLGLSCGIAYCQAKSCPGGTWERFEDTSLDRTIDEPFSNVASADECRAKCEDDTMCVAIDYRTSPDVAGSCLLYYDAPEELRMPTEGVVHIRLTCRVSTSEPEPVTTSEPKAEPDWAIPEAEEIMNWVVEYPEYTAMIGMGILVVLLVITAVCLICCLSGRDRK